MGIRVKNKKRRAGDTVWYCVVLGGIFSGGRADKKWRAGDTVWHCVAGGKSHNPQRAGIFAHKRVLRADKMWRAGSVDATAGGLQYAKKRTQKPSDKRNDDNAPKKSSKKTAKTLIL